MRDVAEVRKDRLLACSSLLVCGAGNETNEAIPQNLQLQRIPFICAYHWLLPRQKP